MKKTYPSLKAKIQNLLGATIQSHTVIDQFIYGAAEAIDEAYSEIEANKSPHIYSGLKGSRIDGLGMLIGCPRYENETDQSYLTRCMAHHTSHQASNKTAILMALTNLEYTSHVSYTPFTQGVGTATIHFIPLDYENVDLAKKEINQRLKKVVAPDSYIKLEAAKPVGIQVVAYCNFKQDTDELREKITQSIKDYINNIPIGETLSYSAINLIALKLESVKHFNTTAIYIDKERMHALERIQTIQEKFLFQNIIFEVSND